MTRVIELLVRGDYPAVESLTRGERFSAADIAEAMDQYSGTIAFPPPEAYAQLLTVVEITGAAPRSWYVNMPLWTLEEGRSDLTVELTIRKPDVGIVIELDNIHVL